MMPLSKVLAGAVVAAAMMSAAPAAAQYYPYGNGYGAGPMMGNAPGYGYGYGGYDGNQSPMVSQCTAAVQARLSGSGGYGYSTYGNGNGGRVLGISRVDPRDDGGFTVRGVAASGAYGFGGNQQPDLTFRCRTDFRGTVTDVSIQPAQRAYSPYGSYGTAPYGYAQPYGQSPYDQGQYYQDRDNSGPYGYTRY
ncbi:hypothetical protein [Sphingomonas sp.]|uniref:hypothetical protein n=1 Tax=Sphingomonas sp. TaxID=28214 RepID=UPI0025FB0865|nr:hypothetical protein [Sphingomonas sp.]MBV9527684.1 hypothetical protein [Sphingomonas sp.]